ncbi:MAG TPA: ABC transporter permease subunit [Polyangia bacterium]|jgi:general L-amino acid transport system permease protein|nr:ABC transporter permease subunit [Polyangia bacterium]
MTDGPRRRRDRRPWALQAALLLSVTALGWALIAHALATLRAQGVAAGFGFLRQPAGFEIGESWLGYDPQRSLARAFIVGLSNTIRVALPACALTTILGTLIGLGRRAPYRPARALCTAYVELVRNVPLLVQLLMWYFALTTFLPDAGDAWRGPFGVYLSKSGLSFPWPAAPPGHWWPWTWDRPIAGPLNVSGGGAVTPEYLAVLLALTVYTAAFVAEVVRAGIEAVPIEQVQAAQAQGLRSAQIIGWIVLPQALRVMVPSLTNQYLNLTKNSTLGVAVGYPELVSISNTALNQTGRAFECITVITAIYLALSLLTSAAMNRYNARVALRGAR